DPVGDGDPGVSPHRAGSSRQRSQIPEHRGSPRNMDAIHTHRRRVRDHAGSGSGVENTNVPGGLRHRDCARTRNLLRITRAKTVRLFALAAALSLGAAQATSAQLPPNENWRTLRTPHFRVHFTPAI